MEVGRCLELAGDRAAPEHLPVHRTSLTQKKLIVETTHVDWNCGELPSAMQIPQQQGAVPLSLRGGPDGPDLKMGTPKLREAMTLLLTWACVGSGVCLHLSLQETVLIHVRCKFRISPTQLLSLGC